MKKILYFAFLLVFVLNEAGCEKEELEGKTFTIKYGSECGWCAGQEYITITSAKVEYVRNIPCGEEMGITNKSRFLNSVEWKEITSSFDYELFKKLNYTECNVCADGCDEIIKITDSEFAHELRYTSSSEVEGMESLKQKLSAIMEEMRVMN